MKKEVWFLVIAIVLVMLIAAFFLRGGIAGMASVDEPRYRVVVSLRTPDPLSAGAVVADVSSEKDKIDLMKVRVRAAQDEVVSDVNSKGLFSFMAGDDLIVEKKFGVVPAMVVSVTEDGLSDLLNDDLVEGVYPDYVFEVGLSESVPLINASPALFNVSGRGVGVCVIDTGIDTDHPAFAGRILAQKCFCSNDCCPNGQSVDNSSEDDSSVSHGTHVSGIAASNGSVKGVAPGANIISVKACDNQGSCFTSDILSAIDFCVQNKVKYNISIISGSFGDNGQHTSDSCPDFIDSALDAASAVDIFLVFASGNNGYSGGISYPACYNNSISVAATTKADAMASFSNRGPNLDLLAPGVSIYSTTIGGYGSLSGTSQATPHVSGYLALLSELAQRYAQYNISHEDILDALNKTDVFIEGFPRINVGMGLAYIHSLINVSGNGSDSSNSSGSPPIINISSPVNGSQVNNPVNFSAYAFDQEDGILNVSWILDNSSGNSSFTGNFSLNLSFGNHSVLAFAVDSDNLSINRTIFFEVVDQAGRNESNSSNNSAPVVEILSPVNNSFVGRNVTLVANVSDEDSNLSGSWSSSLQGFLGSGNNLSVLLNNGSHIITFSVVDSGNLTSNVSVVLHVGHCLIDFDRNSNSLLDIGDVVLLFNEFLNNSLVDSSGAFCPQSGACLFEFDQNNNSVYDIGDIVILFNAFLEGNITTPSGSDCFS